MPARPYEPSEGLRRLEAASIRTAIKAGVESGDLLGDLGDAVTRIGDLELHRAYSLAIAFKNLVSQPRDPFVRRIKEVAAPKGGIHSAIRLAHETVEVRFRLRNEAVEIAGAELFDALSFLTFERDFGLAMANIADRLNHPVVVHMQGGMVFDRVLESEMFKGVSYYVADVVRDGAERKVGCPMTGARLRNDATIFKGPPSQVFYLQVEAAKALYKTNRERAFETEFEIVPGQLQLPRPLLRTVEEVTEFAALMKEIERSVKPEYDSERLELPVM